MGETRLFVGNVPRNASEQDLQSEFGFYGVVKSVEIKQKSEDEHFAFVNIQIEERLVEKCIREFGQQQFKGNYLSVSRAKESFLERLKREREEAAEKSQPQQSSSAYKEDNDYYRETYQPLPKIEKQVSSDESSSEEEEEEIPQPPPVKKFLLKPSTNGYGRNYDPTTMDKAQLDDMKRHESLLKLKERHDEQRRAIKNALLSIDSTTPRNNKIIFEPPEPPTEVVETNESQSKQSNKRKAQLFDGDEDEEEAAPEPFKTKKQFAGKNGEKLFELQTRFQNDKRFEIDEKFADDGDDTFDARKKYTREELKERKKLRKEMENWDQNEMKEERDHQLSILEGITGESTGFVRNSQAKPPQKGMLRFDPSKKDHLKYLDLVKGDEALEEMDCDDQTDEKNRNFEVSEEKFYEVSENLAKSLQQKSESKPFSIFDMLGVNHEDEPEEEPKPEEPKVLAKIPTFNLNQVKFKYDSSDTDEEAEKMKARKKKVIQKKSKGGKYSKSGVWRHNFFVADGDERLKEAFAFLKKSEPVSSEAYDEKRNKLKQVIKSKIRKAKHDQRRFETTSKKRKV